MAKQLSTKSNAKSLIPPLPPADSPQMIRLQAIQDVLRIVLERWDSRQWDELHELADELRVPYLFVALADMDEMENTAVQTRNIEEWLQWRAELAAEGRK